MNALMQFGAVLSGVPNLIAGRAVRTTVALLQTVAVAVRRRQPVVGSSACRKLMRGSSDKA